MICSTGASMALGKLLETAPALRADQSLEESLEKIALAIQSSTPFNSVLVSVLDPESKHLHRIAGAGIPSEVMKEIKTQPQTWESIQTLLKPEYLLGRCYFIPHEKMPVKPADVQTINLLETAPQGDSALQPHLAPGRSAADPAGRFRRQTPGTDQC